MGKSSNTVVKNKKENKMSKETKVKQTKKFKLPKTVQIKTLIGWVAVVLLGLACYLAGSATTQAQNAQYRTDVLREAQLEAQTIVQSLSLTKQQTR